MVIDPTIIPRIVWCIVIAIIGIYEWWGIMQGYRFTLTAGMRWWLKKWPWLKVPLTILLLWLIWHFVVEQ